MDNSRPYIVVYMSSCDDRAYVKKIPFRTPEEGQTFLDNMMELKEHSAQVNSAKNRNPDADWTEAAEGWLRHAHSLVQRWWAVR